MKKKNSLENILIMKKVLDDLMEYWQTMFDSLYLSDLQLLQEVRSYCLTPRSPRPTWGKSEHTD